jgi:hypothetical protein
MHAHIHGEMSDGNESDDREGRGRSGEREGRLGALIEAGIRQLGDELGMMMRGEQEQEGEQEGEGMGEIEMDVGM